MSLDLVDLDPETRSQMLAELAADVAAGDLSYSPRLSAAGRLQYAGLLEDAFRGGTCDSLVLALSAPGVLSRMELSRRKENVFNKRVPHTAPATLAEGEFNRYYLRGLCLTVVALGGNSVLVYRARPSRSPRPESEAMIGRLLDAEALLTDLRIHQGVDTALGLPPGPNSGLSARHPVP